VIDSLLQLAASNPVTHVIDKPIFGWLFSNVTFMLIVSALITYALVVPAARKIMTGDKSTVDGYRAKGIIANLVETVCLYLRNDVFKPVLQDQTDKYVPMLWTMFWFILVCNLAGMVPLGDTTVGIAVAIFGEDTVHGWHFHGVGGTATQSIWVTGALALISAAFYMGAAIKTDPVGFCKHLTGGAPIFMWPIMIPVEIMGYAIKPFALAIRLFANMTGGHLVIAVLLSFVPAAFKGMGLGGGAAISVISIGGAIAINFLELLVACIQAYIFTFLTCLFLAQLVVHAHHDHEHDEEHDEEHAAAH
jgi:F-type H+-transporting ATPase subunit a